MSRYSYVAFLRGINVGGNKMIKMNDLQRLFSSLGFTNIKTVLASGNILFETTETSETALVKKTEAELKKHFGSNISIVLRSAQELQRLIQTDPFAQVTMTPNTRLLVTFLAEEHTKMMTIPFVSPQKDFTIVYLAKKEVCSTFELAPNRGTLDLMAFIEKEFGKNVTTRTWNTVQKIAKLLC